MLLLALCLVVGRAQAEHATILPAPQQITYGNSTLPLAGLPIRLPSGATEDDRAAAQTLAGCITYATGTQTPIVNDSAETGIALHRTGAPDPLPVPGETPGPDSREAYTVRITSSGAEVKARSSAGIFYGVQTLCQMIEMPGAVLPEAQRDRLAGDGLSRNHGGHERRSTAAGSRYQAPDRPDGALEK